MDTAVIVALITFLGSVIGTAGGILAAGRLTAFRLEQLEKKLDLQSKNVAKIPVIEEKIHSLKRRISVLERDGNSYFDAVN